MCFLKNLLNSCENSAPKRALALVVAGMCKENGKVFQGSGEVGVAAVPEMLHIWYERAWGEKTFYQWGATVPNSPTNWGCLKGNPAAALRRDNGSIIFIYVISTSKINSIHLPVLFITMPKVIRQENPRCPSLMQLHISRSVVQDILVLHDFIVC